jgi:hypothetical protein
MVQRKVRLVAVPRSVLDAELIVGRAAVVVAAVAVDIDVGVISDRDLDIAAELEIIKGVADHGRAEVQHRRARPGAGRQGAVAAIDPAGVGIAGLKADALLPGTRGPGTAPPVDDLIADADLAGTAALGQGDTGDGGIDAADRRQPGKGAGGETGRQAARRQRVNIDRKAFLGSGGTGGQNGGEGADSADGKGLHGSCSSWVLNGPK